MDEQVFNLVFGYSLEDEHRNAGSAPRSSYNRFVDFLDNWDRSQPLSSSGKKEF